ncbi:hypothetical protein [Streptomyces chartreusis]|uniref:hypothetical protein n=1 Tax=Streptomyces chartreusis TaxID=1969 RepID=UPI0037DD1864|nr:hypothetical protein OG938_48140 [Streptomyces chartreusis]WTA33866.1 hypothetical protein OIA45_48505 [Streptomyces chartreusis]
MALDANVQAWLLAQLGTTTPVTDLEARYTRLGTARAVAIEVLYERKAALIQSPASVNVSGAVAVTFTENIKALERQIALLESGEPPAPDDPAGTGDDTVLLGTFQLVERRRR